MSFRALIIVICACIAVIIGAFIYSKLRVYEDEIGKYRLKTECIRYEHGISYYMHIGEMIVPVYDDICVETKKVKVYIK